MMKSRAIILVVFLMILLAAVFYFFKPGKYSSDIFPSVIDKTIVLTKEFSPYHLKGHCIIKSKGSLIVEPGVRIIYYDTMGIEAHGPLKIIGSENQPVHIIPADSSSEFLRIRILKVSDTSYFEKIISQNFSITLEGSNAVVRNSYFSLFRSNGWPIIYSLYSNLKFSGNTLINTKIIYVGEGIVAYDGHAEITNSIIKGFPDAVEFSRIADSRISNNVIYNSLDDAIDLNACKNMDISHNLIFGALDKGISAGSDIGFNADSIHWGESHNISISFNLIKNCKTGISIKDACSFKAFNNTIYACSQGFNAHRKNKSSGGPKGQFLNNIIDSCYEKSYVTDRFCKIEAGYCLINGFKPEGEYIFQGNPMFISPEKNDFRLQQGSPCRNSGKQVDNIRQTANIGAF